MTCRLTSFYSAARLGAALWLPGLAAASPTIAVEARVHDDLRGISGELVVGGADPTWTWVDPLADLPAPAGDRDRMRTWPGRADEGAVVYDPTTGAFETELPRRFGALGTARRGLFANGGWLPQPLAEDGLPTITWQVQVTFPEGVTGVVGDEVGTGTVTWTGSAERVSVAAMRDATVSEVRQGALVLQVVSPGRLPARVRSSLDAQLQALAPTIPAGDAAVVISPMRTRLARPGPGVLFLSDRAWRLTPGLRRFHDAPLRRGLAAALLDQPDAFTRDLAAAALSDGVETGGMRETLKWVAWIPLVDQTLNDRSMPFATETLDDVVPDHPVRDDLAERFDATWPGTAVVSQLDARYGPGASDAVGVALRDQELLDEDVADWLQGFDAPPVEQDYQLTVQPDTVTVERLAPADAPVEAVVVEVGDTREVWVTPEGPGVRTWLRTSPGAVAFDPERAVPQTSGVRERYPRRMLATFTGSAGNISLRPLALDGFATVNLRRADDSRTVFSPGVFFGDQVLAEARFSVVRMAGRPLDALTREHQVAVGPSLLWLDPRYAPDADSGSGVAVGATYTWDTKGGALFPLRGHTVTVGVEAGTLLTAPETWTLARLRAAGVVALHPRMVLAAQATGAVSDSDFAHKELDLGALEGMLSVPIGTVRGRARAIGRAELRVAPIRYASVPLLVLWGSEVQLTAGVEAGLLDTGAGVVRAVGATGGLGLVFDWAGAKPSMTGITAGWPVWTDGFEVEPTPWPQLVVRAKQWF